MKASRVVLGLAAVAISGCLDVQAPANAPEVSGPRVGVRVAALDLPQMTDACYGLSVYNTTDIASFGPATEVWTQPALCASEYGAQGGIRFTGVCDALAPGDDHDNSVRLVLNAIYENGAYGTEDAEALVAGSDYVNPCPPVPDGVDNGCILSAPCGANQDTEVEFNLVVMRDASFGFFDTVVRFQDVFCAAKLDCVDEHGDPLTYLFDPAATPPGDGPTAVLGFACRSGDPGLPVFMYLDDIAITCGTTDGDGVLTPTRTAIVAPTPWSGRVTPDDPDEILFGATVNSLAGAESGTYWNVLLGLNLGGDTPPAEVCTLHASGTATEAALPGGSTAGFTRYPFISWTVPLSTGGVRTCSRHPLNDPSTAVDPVRTLYTSPEGVRVFHHELAPPP